MIRRPQFRRPLPRDHHQRRIAALDPQADAETIYRLTALYEFAWEMSIGLNLAFYRTFAAPRIAAVLARSGEVERSPRKRSFDTGLYMYELIEHGYDHPRGREVVRALNRLHHRWDITNEDYLYVLATFVVVPTRWIDDFGWRQLTAVEREATAAFYYRLGQLMAIRDIPDGYEGFAQLLDEYEAAHLARTDAGVRQMVATQQIIADRFPRPLRALAPIMTGVLLDDRLCDCLGVPPAGPRTRRAVRTLLRVRGAAVQRLPARRQSWFTPGEMAHSVYPHGYAMHDLGPAVAGDAAEVEPQA